MLYFASSAKQNIVGGKNVSCFNGASYWGQQTAYAERVMRTPCFGDKSPNPAS